MMLSLTKDSGIKANSMVLENYKWVHIAINTTMAITTIVGSGLKTENTGMDFWKLKTA